MVISPKGWCFSTCIRGISRCLNLCTSPHTVMWAPCFIFLPACKHFVCALTSAFHTIRSSPFGTLCFSFWHGMLNYRGLYPIACCLWNCICCKRSICTKHEIFFFILHLWDRFTRSQERWLRRAFYPRSPTKRPKVCRRHSTAIYNTNRPRKTYKIC